MIAIIDYGMGNLGSIHNMLYRLGHNSCITSDAEEIISSEKLILPGVGAFDNGITSLKKMGLIQALNEVVKIKKKPLLGICLGMQLLLESSEEGRLEGLSWIKGHSSRFNFNHLQQRVPVPHMGWNYIIKKKNHPILRNVDNDYRFYFVHSYRVVPHVSEDILTYSKYGDIKFVSSIQQENIVGVQFHPEKSHKFGMSILDNFAKYV